jgi:hypothetical protein
VVVVPVVPVEMRQRSESVVQVEPACPARSRAHLLSMLPVVAVQTVMEQAPMVDLE